MLPNKFYAARFEQYNKQCQSGTGFLQTENVHIYNTHSHFTRPCIACIALSTCEFSLNIGNRDDQEYVEDDIIEEEPQGDAKWSADDITINYKFPNF